MELAVQAVVAAFGAKAKAKLSNPAATGEPEDQLRAPFEELLSSLAKLANIPENKVTSVGESSVVALKTRPDYAVTVHGALVGFVELKAPGKGADPRRFKDPHDKAQWEKLHSLPNLMFTDGNAFSLWQDGELVDSVIALEGDIESAGDKLKAGPGLLPLFEKFLHWRPIPPRHAKDLAKISARLCRLLRDEVTEQLALGSEALTALATDWRKMLFPDATDERFADGYAQAVTFGLLMARASDIPLASGFDTAARELAHTSSLIGAALRLLTENAENQKTLQTSLKTLIRVLDAVNWTAITKGRPEAWLYFYEEFLEVYDNALRKKTGSYYTPPEVVESMVRLVAEVLRSSRFGLNEGLAAPSVKIADPATGTGTFLLGILRNIADTVKTDQGEGPVPASINAAIDRLIAFEMQLGPFAVAQLRILAEIKDLTGGLPKTQPRMFVTNTLGNPYAEQEWLPAMPVYQAIGESRRKANQIKATEPITVVIGNPPYKEKAKGLGGWIEGEADDETKKAPLVEWMPPKDWHAGAHSKHLRNLYVYFWRWATWKVFDHHPNSNTGIVCFITVAGFLAGPGFQKMRDYLRRTCDDIWVIDCSPEGHQPEVNTRIFQDVQQPICIVLASRSTHTAKDSPAKVRFHSLPIGHRSGKFVALKELALNSDSWTDSPAGWRDPFLPTSTGAWAGYVAIEQFFIYNGSGVMPGRTWIISPDAESLAKRWVKLIGSPTDEKELLFHPHLRNGKPGDKHIHKIVSAPLADRQPRKIAVADDAAECESPAPYGFRSFDRQWIIPDSRLINQPNPELWKIKSATQIYLTAPSDRSPTSGPAVSLTAIIPDLHHYNGRGGRVFPLWRDAESKTPNLRPKLLTILAEKYNIPVQAGDLFAYIAAVAAHPAYTSRFQPDLSTPGLRIPMTADPGLFQRAVEIGRTVIWLHAFGERMADPGKERPSSPPRLPYGRRPTIPKEGSIPDAPDKMPDVLSYDATGKRLHVGLGYVENVEPAVWNYEVSGKQVLVQWFSYRRKNRERPIIGDRRQPSPLGDIQPDHWLAEYTTELLNVLNVLGLLVQLEPQQAELLDQICQGPLLSYDELRAAGAFELPEEKTNSKRKPEHPDLFQ